MVVQITSMHDVYCGPRGFRKDVYYLLDERCTRMKFAVEARSSYRQRVTIAMLWRVICVPENNAWNPGTPYHDEANTLRSRCYHSSSS